MSIIDAQKINADAQAREAKILADPDLTLQAKYTAWQQLAWQLTETLDALKAKDLAADAAFESRYTTQARSVLPSQQADFRQCQADVEGITNLRSAQAAADKAKAAGDVVKLTAIGLHAYDTGLG